MKKFFVRKIFKYDPTFAGKYSRFDGYVLITSFRNDPAVSEISDIKIPNRINEPLFTSTLERSKQTGEIVGEKFEIRNHIGTHDLDEVRFDLAKLVSKEEFEKDGSNLVRKRFIEFFIKDKLIETRSSIEKRIKSLISNLQKLPDGNYLLISHSFYMKILQSYLKSNDLFEKPEILATNFDSMKKTFDFGKGFDFSLP